MKEFEKDLLDIENMFKDVFKEISEETDKKTKEI